MNNLKQYFSNNKGIFIFVVFITIFLGSKKSYSNNCLSFLPYGYNDDYVHLPPDASFCVKEGNKKVQYLTDFLGGRIIAKKKQQILFKFLVTARLLVWK